MLCHFNYNSEINMDEKNVLSKVSKKSKFLWLYIMIIISILILIVIFVFMQTSSQEDMFDVNGNFPLDENLIDDQELVEEEIPFFEIKVDDPENCGNNMTCFREYSSSCMEGARFLFTETIDSEYKVFTRTTEYVIQGIENIYCKVNLSLYDIEVELKGDEDNYNESVVSKEDIGVQGTCYFQSPQSLLDYLEMKENKTFNGSVDCFYLEDKSIVCSSSGDMINNTCEGPYFMLQYE